MAQPLLRYPSEVVGGEAYTYSKLNSALRNDNYFVGGHYDFMFDVVNFFSTYNPNRVFHIIPYVGVGYEYKFNHTVAGLPNTHAATANGGLQLSFHVAPRVNIFVEGEATYNGFHIRSLTLLTSPTHSVCLLSQV